MQPIPWDTYTCPGGLGALIPPRAEHAHASIPSLVARVLHLFGLGLFFRSTAFSALLPYCFTHSISLCRRYPSFVAPLRLLLLLLPAPHKSLPHVLTEAAVFLIVVVVVVVALHRVVVAICRHPERPLRRTARPSSALPLTDTDTPQLRSDTLRPFPTPTRWFAHTPLKRTSASRPRTRLCLPPRPPPPRVASST